MGRLVLDCAQAPITGHEAAILGTSSLAGTETQSFGEFSTVFLRNATFAHFNLT